MVKAPKSCRQDYPVQNLSLFDSLNHYSTYFAVLLLDESAIGYTA